MISLFHISFYIILINTFSFSGINVIYIYTLYLWCIKFSYIFIFNLYIFFLVKKNVITFNIFFTCCKLGHAKFIICLRLNTKINFARIFYILWLWQNKSHKRAEMSFIVKCQMLNALFSILLSVIWPWKFYHYSPCHDIAFFSLKNAHLALKNNRSLTQYSSNLVFRATFSVG